jgi:hypothetical protein
MIICIMLIMRIMVIMIMRIMVIILIILIMVIMHMMLIIGKFRSVSIWVLWITCGRTRVPPSPRRLMDWALSFVQPLACAMVGLNTSRTRMRPGRRRRQSAHPLDRGRWSWTIKDDLLLLLQQPENDDLLLLHRLRKSWRRISSMNTHPKRRLYF